MCSDGRAITSDEKGSDIMKKTTRKQLMLERDIVKVLVVTLPTADLGVVRGGDPRAAAEYYFSGGSGTNPTRC